MPANSAGILFIKGLFVNKRYQVFISSTYADLAEERQNVLKTLMKLDCFPAGMEHFPANDTEQFEFIKTIINDSDYYVLIIGARYGSLTSDGISYTEAEYNYAKEIGLPVLAFIHRDPDSLPINKSDTDAKLVRKLEKFRHEVSQGRLVDFWEKPEELPAKVTLGIVQATKMQPGTGWVRGNQISSQELLSELHDLRAENDTLKTKLDSYEESALIDKSDLADFTDLTNLRYFLIDNIHYPSFQNENELVASWELFFSAIAAHIYQGSMSFSSVQEVYENLALSQLNENERVLKSIRLFDSDVIKLQYQFIALGLLNVNVHKRWSLTDYGIKQTVKLLATKKAAK